MVTTTNSGNKAQRLDLGLAAVLAVFLTVIFWLGRSHTYGPGDSPQHVFCALLWAVPHPPGYPLQTALGWIWSQFWSEPAAAVNGLSGIFHALAGSVLFILLRQTGCRRISALCAVGFMSLSPLFWYYSLVAEVRAFNDLLALLTACFALQFKLTGRKPAAILLSFFAGLGIAHHPTFVLLLPAFGLWIFHKRFHRQLMFAVMSIALILPYALLALRLGYSQPEYNLFGVSGMTGMWNLFTRKNLGGPLRMTAGAGLISSSGFNLQTVAIHFGWLLNSMWLNVGPIALAMSSIGIYVRMKKDAVEVYGWLLWFAITVGTVVIMGSAQMRSPHLNYLYAVISRFYLLPLISIFALSAYGFDFILSKVRPIFSYGLVITIFILPLIMRPLSLAKDNFLYDHMKAMIRDSHPGDIIVLGSDDTNFAALDLELVRRESSGRIFLSPSIFSLPRYAQKLKTRYPDLVIPPSTQAGLTTDWLTWKALNPSTDQKSAAKLRWLFQPHVFVPRSVSPIVPEE
jgi:hypothetical protein